MYFNGNYNRVSFPLFHRVQNTKMVIIKIGATNDTQSPRFNAYHPSIPAYVFSPAIFKRRIIGCPIRRARSIRRPCIISFPIDVFLPPLPSISESYPLAYFVTQL